MRMFFRLLAIAIFAGTCPARVITVPGDYTNIQAAINSAVNGDTVLIAPGIYTGTGNRDISFSGKTITITGINPDDQNIVAATVVDGGGIDAGSHRGFAFIGQANSSILRGLTIANFYVSDKSGGGIYSVDASPTIENCVLRDNQCSFYIGQRGGYGAGGFYLLGGTPKFINCVIKGNTAFYYGGGGTCEVSDVTFTGCVFEDNYAQLAGALCAFDGKATLDSCTFIRNRNYNDGDNGGYDKPAALYFYIEHSGTVVRNCLFTENMGLGGTVQNECCSPTYDSCIFVGNFAGYQAAVWNNGNGGIPANPVFLHCTIANNTGEWTGGMRTENLNNENSSPTLSHCILWGNYPKDMFTQSGGSPQISYTCMGTAPDGPYQGSVIIADPLFVNMAAGDVHLRSGSPCINAGDPTIHYTGQTDFDGRPRVMGGRIDIGAYEYWSPPRTIYVDANATGANNGTSWANAFRYLQDALSNNPITGEKICVAEGVYRPDRGADMMLGYKQSVFRLVSGVTMEGGYAGFGAPDPNKRDVELYKTILSGDLSGNDVNNLGVTQLYTAPSRSENCDHVVAATSVDANTVLDGFVIEKGNANGTSYNGGGLYISSGSPTIKNCTFRLNTARTSGGAVYNTLSSNPKFINCRFAGNYALNTGGGMNSNSSSIPTLINCDICGNYSTSCGGVGGTQSSLNMKNCVLYGNSDPNGNSERAQILVTSGTATVNYSCIQNWTGVLGGIGNFFADPLFVDVNDNTDATHYDFHLLPDSLCIDAGEPNSSCEAEPWPNGARINIGSYGNTPQATQSRNGMQFAGFNIIDKTRIGRTTYRYILSLSLTNTTAGNMTNVYVKLIEACEPVTKIIDGNIFFPQINAGNTVDSNILGDFFIVEVDRSKLIIPGRLTWQVDYAMSGASQMHLMSADFMMEDNSTPGDITGNGVVDYDDILVLCEQWLQPPGTPSADIAPTPTGDGIVNWLDFAVLANNWVQ